MALIMLIRVLRHVHLAARWGFSIRASATRAAMCCAEPMPTPVGGAACPQKHFEDVHGHLTRDLAAAHSARARAVDALRQHQDAELRAEQYGHAAALGEAAVAAEQRMQEQMARERAEADGLRRALADTAERAASLQEQLNTAHAATRAAEGECHIACASA